jgi:cytosine/adenosine deaminase-related metal-dependent hydrolase
MNPDTQTPYFSDLDSRIRGAGGYFNAHLHLDRAGTYHETVRLLQTRGVRDGAALSLPRKHAVIPLIHASDCYEPGRLEARVEPYIHRMIALGTRRADTVVDVTADRVGLTALQVFKTLKERHRDRIDLRIGAYSPLGFRDDEAGRWTLLQEGAAFADFIGLLPERDDRADYPDHIGFEESCRRGILLAHSLGKHIHIHVDQANHCHERGAERAVEVVRELGLRWPNNQEPPIWLIHLISPSCYEEGRFHALVRHLVELNIGVICCPSAAISMRAYRPFASPTFNSIARVLELLAAGVQVRIGSDNVCDITSPMGTVNLLEEIFVLANAVRYYDLDILTKIAAGIALVPGEKARICAHLDEDAQFVASVVARFSNGAPQ